MHLPTASSMDSSTFEPFPSRHGRNRHGFEGRGHTTPGQVGRAWMITHANARLMKAMRDQPNVFVLDAEKWLVGIGGGAYHPKLWYGGKVPFVDMVFDRAAHDIRALVAVRSGLGRKLLVVDLDNTLWGGVVGDDGIEGIRLGGHDADGEAFVDLQRGLLQLRRRGVMLAIASKNEESTALAAIDNHDEMILRRSDFVAWQINWGDKAANIAALADELNIGLQSIVFIDDNPHERDRVREVLPEVLVPEWPVDPARAVVALNDIWVFDGVGLTDEDTRRTELYGAERERQQLVGAVGSLDEWIEQLELVVTVRPLSDQSLARSVQLLNKTNQMNLRTRRVTEAEFRMWSDSDDTFVKTVSVADRIGESGLTGVVSGVVEGDDLRIIDFVLSCRVMGRSIEETLLAVAARHAESHGATSARCRVDRHAEKRSVSSILRTHGHGWRRTPHCCN